jgi:hypothetical protein
MCCNLAELQHRILGSNEFIYQKNTQQYGSAVRYTPCVQKTHT